MRLTYRGAFVISYNIFMNKKVLNGTVHKTPKDFKESLIKNSKALETWNDITPLARNEWICWTISVKKEETRISHIKRALNDLSIGKRRPCCWPGCTHR